MEPFCFKLQPNGAQYTLTWPTPSLHPQGLEREAGKKLQNFQDDQLEASYEELERSDSKNDSSVLIFPVIQAGQFDIREEERCLDLLFGHLNRYSKLTGSKALIDFTSGYFSLSEAYQKFVQGSCADCRILCASPEV